MSAYRNDENTEQEMTMDEILASIRRFVAPEEAAAKKPATASMPYNGFSQQSTYANPQTQHSTAETKFQSATTEPSLKSAPLHDLLNPIGVAKTQSSSHPSTIESTLSQDMYFKESDVVRLHPNARTGMAPTTPAPQTSQTTPVEQTPVPTQQPSPAHFQTPSQGVNVMQTTEKVTMTTSQSNADTSLLEETVLTSTLASFEKLSSAVEQSKTVLAQDNTSVISNKLTLDQVFYEIAKPMIKSWLDNHLPTMVETMVTREIERITKGSK